MPILSNLRPPTLHETATVIASGVAIVGGLTFFGIGVTVPWASASDVKEIRETIKSQQETIQSQQKALQIQGQAILELRRDYYKKRLDQANAELKRNPDSETAQRQKAEAEAWIAWIDKQLAAPPAP